MVQRQRVTYNKGFTLIEMMFAIFLIMISMLALLTCIITATRASGQNDVRFMAVRLANQTGEALIALPNNDTELSVALHARAPVGQIQGINNGTSQAQKGIPDTTQTVRDYQQSYTIQWNVVSINANTVQIRITVSYTYKSVAYSHDSMAYKYTTT